MLTLIAAIAVILGIAIHLDRYARNWVLNPYRLQYTGDLLVDYMDRYDDWPKDWDQLLQFARSNQDSLQEVRAYRDLQYNIKVDFSFKPFSKELSMEDIEGDSQLRLVVAYDGTFHGATRDPNTTILRYLQERHQKKE
jgi:hypothetical protein